MPTKAKTTVGKTPACLDKSGEDGHLGGGKIRQTNSHGEHSRCGNPSNLSGM
jgi:hypothetical protein